MKQILSAIARFFRDGLLAPLTLRLMAVQLSVAVRNARLDAIETVVGTTPKLQIRTGAQPANCAAAASGTLLAEITLPSDWAAAASAGSKAMSGTWQVNAVAAGTAAHYRLVDSAGTTCHEQGTVTATGGGGDLTLDNTSIASGQQVTITTWTKTDGNA
jgi:hypothetical protein